MRFYEISFLTLKSHFSLWNIISGWNLTLKSHLTIHVFILVPLSGWLLYVNQHKLCQITFWPASVEHWPRYNIDDMWSYWSPLSGWLLFVVFICQFVADVGCLSIRCLCAAVVHDKIPLESVMKWCSMQVIIFSFPSVVDCCLFYFFVCCCMLLHIVVYCCMLLFVVAWLMLFRMDFDNACRWCNACCSWWMLDVETVDDACW